MGSLTESFTVRLEILRVAFKHSSSFFFSGEGGGGGGGGGRESETSRIKY